MGSPENKHQNKQSSLKVDILREVAFLEVFNFFIPVKGSNKTFCTLQRRIQIKCSLSFLIEATVLYIPELGLGGDWVKRWSEHLKVACFPQVTSVKQSLQFKRLPSNTVQNGLHHIQTVQETDVEIRWITAARKSRKNHIINVKTF